MTTNSQVTKRVTDIIEFFSDDLYESSLLYFLPDISTSEFTTSYKSREDLIATDMYSSSQLLGLVLLSVGETVYKDGSKIKTVDEAKPHKTLNLMNLSDVVNSQVFTVTKNVLTSKDINKERRPNVKHYKLNSSGKFEDSDTK